jgi:hypothetical protein
MFYFFITQPSGKQSISRRKTSDDIGLEHEHLCEVQTNI